MNFDPKSILTKAMKCDNSDLKAVLPENRCNNFRQAIVPDAFWIFNFNLSRLSWQDVKSNRQDPPFSRLLKAGHTNFTESAAVQIKTGLGSGGSDHGNKNKQNFLQDKWKHATGSKILCCLSKAQKVHSQKYKLQKVQNAKKKIIDMLLLSRERWSLKTNPAS